MWTNFLADTGYTIPVNSICLDAGCGPAGIFTILNEQQVTALDPVDAYTAK